MRKTFKVEMDVTVVSDSRTEEQCKDMIKSLFNNYEYDSIVTRVFGRNLKITPHEQSNSSRPK